MNKCPLGSPPRDDPHTLIQLRIGGRRDLPFSDDVARAIFDSLPFFFMLVDSTHTILFANRAVRDALGVQGRELTGAYCPTAIHGLDHPFPGCPLEEAAAEHVAVERDFYDGESHTWTSSAIYPTTIRSASGHPVYAHVVRDISAQRNAQTAVRERAAVQQLISQLATRFLAAPPLELEAELSSALAMVAEFMGCTRSALYLLDEAGDALVLTQQWTAVSDSHIWEPLPPTLPLEQLALRSSAGVGPLGSSPLWEAPTPAAASEHFSVVPISVAGSPCGFARFEQWAPSPSARMRDADLAKLLSTTLSVGLERLRAARGMSAYARRLRSMALELSAAEERERRRIAADLHDQIGQTLALSMMKVSSLRSQLETPKMSAVLDEVYSHIQSALADAKSLMFELSPPVLHQFGLGAALEWLLEQCASRTGLEYQLSNEAGASRLDDDQEMFLFRATQELIANVHRHARARRVDVSLSRVAGYVEVQVADDGVGIPAHLLKNRQSPRGFGLFSIEERLTHLGGTMLVDSAPGAGTRVTLRLRDSSDASKERGP